MLRARKGKVIVVTGASAGVGRATVRALAGPGVSMALLARGRDGLEGAREEVERAGGTALVLPTDVADPDQVEAAAAAAEEQLGPIDTWINNAMVSVFGPSWEVTPAEFRRVTEVTYLGYVHGTMAALRRMMPRDRGVIVQVGSTLAYRGIPLQSAYCGAKHAIVGFTESLRAELIHEGSRVAVRMVHLPGLNTPQFEWIRSKMKRRSKPVGKIFQPEVAARGIAWATRHKRREMFIGAPTVQAVVADKLAPGLMDRYMAKVVYEGHFADEPEDPDRPDNLFDPVTGDHGAHGPYDALATYRSPQLWATTHRKSIALASAGLAAAAIGMWLGAKDR